MRFLMKGKAAAVVSLAFQAILVSYLLLLLIEQIWKGSVSLYLNLNYVLIVVLILGVLDAFGEHLQHPKTKAGLEEYGFVGLLAVAAIVILKIKTGNLGWLSWVISLVAGILVILLSILVLQEDEDEHEGEKVRHQRSISPKEGLRIGAIVIVLLFIIGAGLSLLSSLTILESLRIMFGGVFVLFLPGFLLTFVFFPASNEGGKEIDLLERIALSFALSIAIVPLAVFYLNLVGVKINVLNSSLIILGIMLITGILLVFTQPRHECEVEDNSLQR